MSSLNVLCAAQRLQQQAEPFCLVTVLRVLAPASARPGDKAVVTADGIVEGWIGGGCAQPTVLRMVRQALADGRARMLRIAPADEGQVRELDDVLEFGMACHSGGTIELFVDPVLPAARLTVIGDSPLAMALTALAPRVGLPVTVVAQGVEGADALRFADAERVLASDDAAAAARELAPGSFVVVATQGRRDLQGLRAALAIGARQVFFVASARKGEVLKAALREAGHDAAQVDAIVAPAGQPIGAQTPEEIALSVLAAVVAARRGKAPAAAPDGARATVPAAQESAARVAATPLGAMAEAQPAGAMAAAGSANALAAVDDAQATVKPASPRRSFLDRIPLPELPPGKGSCCS
jgi:xanthine dehydrogenase accessory factor